MPVTVHAAFGPPRRAWLGRPDMEGLARPSEKGCILLSSFPFASKPMADGLDGAHILFASVCSQQSSQNQATVYFCLFDALLYQRHKVERTGLCILT
jgi:hypothetical protein